MPRLIIPIKTTILHRPSLPHKLATTVLAWVHICLLLSPVTQVISADIYVSPTGDDSQSGTFDAPIKTLQTAIALVHSRHDRPRKIILRGGIYYLHQPLVLTPHESGTQQRPLVITSHGTERVRLSGAQPLTLRWQPWRDGIFRAALQADIAIDQLFVDSSRQPLARYPNFDPHARYFNGFAHDAFSPARVSRWNSPRGGLIHGMHRHHWGDFHFLITGKANDGTLHRIGGWQNNRPDVMHDEHRFVENIFEELDAPGEWFHDKHNKLLYFYPPPQIDLSTALIEAVQLPHLVEFRGTESQPIKHIILKGLELTHTSRTFMQNSEPLLRSDWTTYRGGAILITGGEDIAISELHLNHVGGNGIFISRYNRRIHIRKCYIDSAGASSISFVGDPGAVRSPLFQYDQYNDYSQASTLRGPRNNNYPAECLVENNLLVRNGRFEKQTAGVNISMAAKIQIRHNTIYEVPRAGINICDGTWGGHIIEFNDVFDTVKETGDHGSFNAWGRDRFHSGNTTKVDAWVAEHPDWPLLDAIHTTVIRNNRFRCDYGWDIDLDDGCSNYEIYNNLCLSGGIKNREGFYRTVRNNVMVNNTFHPHVWYADSHDTFTNNIIFADYLPSGMKHWGQQYDFNFLHSPKEKGKATSLKEISGQDNSSLKGNAMFVNSARGDYRVGPNSPALKLGFRNFPMDHFGVADPHLKSISDTPILPESTLGRVLVNYGWGQDTTRRNTPISWQGATIKNLNGVGELSVTGTSKATGVYFVTVPTDSPCYALGLRERDVIFDWNSQSVHELSDFLKWDKEFSKYPSSLLRIRRNQQDQDLTIRRPTAD